MDQDILKIMGFNCLISEIVDLDVFMVDERFHASPLVLLQCFFPPILWCRSRGEHPWVYLAKFGYIKQWK
jgi:hypothetical protein